MQLQDKLRKAFLAATTVIASSLPIFAQDKEAAPVMEPKVFQYAKPDDALPGFDTRLRLYGSSDSNDFDGNMQVGSARLLLNEPNIGVAASHFSKNRELDDHTVVGDPLFGVDTTDKNLENKYSSNSGSVTVGNFNAQVSKTGYEQNELLQNLNVTGGGTNTFLNKFTQNREVETTTGIVTYKFPRTKIALVGRTQNDEVRQQDFSEFDDSTVPFNATIDDIVDFETKRQAFGASGSHLITDELAAGLDVIYNKIKTERTNSHVEIQNGTTTINTRSSVDDDFNPLLVRATARYAPANLPFSAAAGIGYVTDMPQLSDMGNDNNQFIADGAFLLRLGDNFGFYGLAGIDTEGEAYFLPAITFSDSKNDQQLHDFGQFATGQKLYFADPAADAFTFNNRIHGLANNGWTIGALIDTQFDSVKQLNGDAKHFKPFIAGEIGDNLYEDKGSYSGFNVVLSASADIISDDGTTGQLLLTPNVGLGSAGVLEVILGGDVIFNKKVSRPTAIAERPEGNSIGYIFGLGWGKRF